MSSVEPTKTTQSRLILSKAILLTGFLVGTLDIAAAIINLYLKSGRDPVFLLQFIASGVFGKDAFSGGLFTAFCGLMFHYFIATGWAALFYLVYPKFTFLSKNIILSGMGYGLFVWAMMTRIVLPLSNVPRSASFDPLQALIGIAILMIAIGIPVSLRAKRYYSMK